MYKIIILLAIVLAACNNQRREEGQKWVVLAPWKIGKATADTMIAHANLCELPDKTYCYLQAFDSNEVVKREINGRDKYKNYRKEWVPARYVTQSDENRYRGNHNFGNKPKGKVKGYATLLYKITAPEKDGEVLYFDMGIVCPPPTPCYKGPGKKE